MGFLRSSSRWTGTKTPNNQSINMYMTSEPSGEGDPKPFQHSKTLGREVMEVGG